MLPFLASIDEAVFRFVNLQCASPALDKLMMFVSSKYTWLALGALTLGFVLLRARSKFLPLCLLIGATVGISDFITYQLIKPGFARVRPCHQFQDIHLVPEFCGGDYGFPSNHAANGMAVTVILALNSDPMLAALALALTLFVGFSRVYLGVHFPGDVLSGFVFGAAIGFGCHYAYHWLVRRLAIVRGAVKGRL